MWYRSSRVHNTIGNTVAAKPLLLLCDTAARQYSYVSLPAQPTVSTVDVIALWFVVLPPALARASGSSGLTHDDLSGSSPGPSPSSSSDLMANWLTECWRVLV